MHAPKGPKQRRGWSIALFEPERANPDEPANVERSMRRALIAICSALFGSACATTATLLDERSTMPFSALATADRALRSTEGRFVAQDSSTEGDVFVRQVHSDAPAASERPVLVLLNGIFSDGGTWRFNTSLLAQRYDLLVADLPGTGRSVDGGRDSDSTTDYTLDWVAARTWRMLSAWQQSQANARPMVLVGHSYAGAVIVRMLGGSTTRSPFAPARALVSGAVLIATPDIETPEWSPTFVELAELSEEKVALGAAIGLLDARIADGIARSVLRPEAALQQEATRMSNALLDANRRRASQLLMKRIRPTDSRGNPIWPLVHAMAADYARMDVPTLLLWGRYDDTLPLDVGNALERKIHGSRLVVIEDARHSVHQEQPEATVREIVAFVEGLHTPQ